MVRPAASMDLYTRRAVSRIEPALLSLRCIGQRRISCFMAILFVVGLGACSLLSDELETARHEPLVGAKSHSARASTCEIIVGRLAAQSVPPRFFAFGAVRRLRDGTYPPLVRGWDLEAKPVRLNTASDMVEEQSAQLGRGGFVLLCDAIREPLSARIQAYWAMSYAASSKATAFPCLQRPSESTAIWSRVVRLKSVAEVDRIWCYQFDYGETSATCAVLPTLAADLGETVVLVPATVDRFFARIQGFCPSVIVFDELPDDGSCVRVSLDRASVVRVHDAPSVIGPLKSTFVTTTPSLDGRAKGVVWDHGPITEWSFVRGPLDTEVRVAHSDVPTSIALFYSWNKPEYVDAEQLIRWHPPIAERLLPNNAIDSGRVTMALRTEESAALTQALELEERLRVR
jgi:hypothetical protein